MSKKWLALAFKFLVSGLLIWFLVGTIDMGAAVERVKQISPAMLALAFAVFFVQIVLGGVRWRVVLAAIRAPLALPSAIRLFYIGVFFNQALPSSVGGDAVRMYKAWRAGLAVPAAVNGVMLERAAMVLALLIMVAATQPLFLPRVSAEIEHWVALTVALALVGGIGGLALLMTLDRLPPHYSRWRLVRGLRLLAADTRRVFLAVGPLVRVLAWSALAHANLTFAVYLLARGLDLSVTWVDCLALIPPVILATTLPISIGGWGVREGAMVVALGAIGVPAEGALVLSVVAGLVGMASALPGGLIWLLSGDRRVGAVPDPAAGTAAASGPSNP